MVADPREHREARLMADTFMAARPNRRRPHGKKFVTSFGRRGNSRRACPAPQDDGTGRDIFYWRKINGVRVIAVFLTTSFKVKLKLQ